MRKEEPDDDFDMAEAGRVMKEQRLKRRARQFKRSEEHKQEVQALLDAPMACDFNGTWNCIFNGISFQYWPGQGRWYYSKVMHNGGAEAFLVWLKENKHA